MAVGTGKGREFGEDGCGFPEFAEEGTNAQAVFAGGTTMKAVVTDAGEAFGEDVEKPAAQKFVGTEGEEPSFAAAAFGPVQEVVAEGVLGGDALGAEGAALDVAGEVADGGVTTSGGLKLDIPAGGG